MEQTNIFDFIEEEKYKITKPIRMIEFFAGYGSQALALKYLGVPFEHWKICEWAVKSIQAYKDIHFTNDDTDYSDLIPKEDLIEILTELGISSNYNEPMTRKQIQRLGEEKIRTIYNNICATHNLVNIQQVKGSDLEIFSTDKFTYLLTYSFPCQDLSLAGKQKGMSDTSTRSGMLWEVERILTECKILGNMPQVLLMENVPQIHNKKNMPDFQKWIDRLKELGYTNYWQDLIATDYGIPQTRNRTFMVSILGDYNYTFPKPIPLEKKLKDMLEDNVDESYFLSDKMIKYFTRDEEDKFPRKDRFEQALKLTNEKGIAGTITTCAGNRATDNFIKVKNATKQGYLEATDGDGIDISSRMHHHRGTVQKEKIQTLDCTGGETKGVVVEDDLKRELCKELIKNEIVQENDVIKHSYTDQIMSGNKKCVEMNNLMPTMTTRPDCLGVVVKDTENYIEWKEQGKLDINCRTFKENKVSSTIVTTPKNKILQNNLRIRKLTPKECFRLMGVKDEDFENCAKNQSNASLYHLAGDSIVVNVLMAIFKEML